MKAWFRLFRRTNTASVAQRRLQDLLANERTASGDRHVQQRMELLREELAAVITRHIGKGIA